MMMRHLATSALTLAILQGNTARVRILLALHPGIVNERNPNRLLPLHIAAQANSPEIASLLLHNGADPNGLALVETEVDGAQYREALVKRGLDPHTRMIGVAMQTALYMASASGYSEFVRVLVEAGADPDMGFLHEATPLFVACQKNKLEVAQLLLSHGATVDAALENGATPLFIAAQLGHERVVRLLLSRGADVGRRLTGGNHSAPLHVASEHGHLGVVELLVMNGAYLNSTDKAGFSALTTACYFGQHAVAALLLRAGANPDLPCHDGLTALKAATRRGHKGLVQLLTSSGATADVNDGVPIAVRRTEAAIADFRRCLDRAEPWPTLREILSEIIPEVMAGSVSVSAGQMSFFRIRKNQGVDAFHEVTDLFYPPAQVCRSYGRCNRPHAPMLYASTNPIAPLFEVGEMRTGDTFTMTSYVIRNGRPLTLAPIGIGDSAETADHWFSDERRQALVRTSEFLNDLFTLTRTDENYYRLTNEIIDTFFNYPDTSGFLYPSIRRSESTAAYENIAIKPTEVDEKLGVSAVNVFRVTKTDSRGRLVEAERVLEFTEVVDGRVCYAPPKDVFVLAPMEPSKLMKATITLRAKVHYLDLQSAGLTASRLGGSERDPNYVEVVCPECGHRHFQHAGSDLLMAFRNLEIAAKYNVAYIGDHECLKCGRVSSWERWKQSSDLAR
jgi:ankyrin repeat protein